MDILRLLTQAGEATPVPDRAMLSRFRRIVSDLGNDLYVALVGERLVGFVQITYRRDITLGLRGRVESLTVAADERAREVATSLARLAEQRARRRCCFDLRCAPAHRLDEVLAECGWLAAGHELRLNLSETAKERSAPP